MNMHAAKDKRASARHGREAVLASALVLLALMFVVTAFVSRLYKKRVHELGDRWFANGDSALHSGHPTAALADYRNGLAYVPGNEVFQFHLAQALAAAGHADEAEGYLLNLLSASPGNGEINLALARVAVQKKSEPDALRYYHAAIYGGWDEDPIAQRWRARRELCEYLLGRGAPSQAESEIIALADNTPGNDVSQLNAAGNLLLDVSLWSRALGEFKSALAVDRHDPEALTGAGTAEFRLARYSEAAAFFERLPENRRSSETVSEMLATARAAESIDPFLPGLSAAEKSARVDRALADSEALLSNCTQGASRSPGAQQPNPDSLAAVRKAISDRKRAPVERKMGRLDSDMAAVYQAEIAARSACGSPKSPTARALLLIGDARAGGSQ